MNKTPNVRFHNNFKVLLVRRIPDTIGKIMDSAVLQVSYPHPWSLVKAFYVIQLTDVDKSVLVWYKEGFITFCISDY